MSFTSFDTIFDTILDTMTSRYMGAEVGSDRYNLFCYLVGAYRQGKPCIEITDDPHALFDELPDDFAASIRRAYDSLEAESDCYVKRGDRLYLASSYKVMQSIQHHYERLQKAANGRAPNLEKAERLLAAEPLSPEQREAVLHALQAPVAFISGGPGTGKTYTAGSFLKTFLECMPSGLPLQAVLSAPTGKATANLAKSIQRAMGRRIEAKTLHALLQLRPLAPIKKAAYLPYDLLIVDESSMVDARLFQKLLSSLAAGTRLLFLGDPNQLPPIEPGAPFADYAVGAKTLTVCLRTELEAIITLAKLVSEKRADEAIAFLKNAPPSSGISLRLIDDAAVQKQLVTDVAYEKVRLLSPLRTGPLGTQSINQQLFWHYQQRGGKNKEVPIMVLKNDYVLGLSNGQMGIGTMQDVVFETEDGPRVIPRILLGAHEVAFCISVHKSQGSEFDDVLLLLPQGSERFGRKMLYTAITRAKSRLAIWTTESVLRETILR